jgi:hypothetical protein
MTSPQLGEKLPIAQILALPLMLEASSFILYAAAARSEDRLTLKIAVYHEITASSSVRFLTIAGFLQARQPTGVKSR